MIPSTVISGTDDGAMKNLKLPVLALAMCAFLFFSGMALAQQPFSQQSNPPATSVDLSVPDAQLVNQSGEQVRFNSDVIKGRVAVITSFLTNCAAFCPITQEKLAQLAKVLGDKMGREVVFISVSVDPENDTPEKMKAWGEKFHVGTGWSLVSGKKEDVESLLKGLGLYVAIPARHQSALIIGNQKSGWSRVSSWSTPEKLARVVDEHESGKSGSAAVAGAR
jgi:cytochrome oxidase Cu insertion factor (SCO1/SenC/PrrC family)